MPRCPSEPVTSQGRSREPVMLEPRAPVMLRPQHEADPSARNAQVYSSPLLNIVGITSSGCDQRGVKRGVTVELSPTCPCPFAPQQRTAGAPALPWAINEHVDERRVLEVAGPERMLIAVGTS